MTYERRVVDTGARGRRQRHRLRRARRRRASAGVAFAGALLAAVLWFALSGEREPTVRVGAEGRELAERPASSLVELGAGETREWLSRIPAARHIRRGRARITLETGYRLLERDVRRAAAAGGGTVRLPTRAVASSIRLPVVKQALRNNCETAALSMLLAAAGRPGDQLELQRSLQRSGPLDPRQEDDGLVWGDPDRGFVGRPDGGGTAGGYGVYPAPVRELARRRGVALDDLSGVSSAVVYRRLLGGRPVMAWIGLSDGPYRTWRSPEGRTITGNFGEHTVVLTGIRRERLSVNEPLSGRRQTWTRSEFEQLWERLGRRALALES
jgi:uncharacterized protein YvpB